MENGHKLTYALRHGDLVSIDEVGRGLRLDCTCPACGGILVARKGNERIPHFAHRSGDKCETAAETALHLLAKKIICTPGTVLSLPIYEIATKVALRRSSGQMREAVQGVADGFIDVVDGAQEVRFAGFTADAVVDVFSKPGHCLKRLLVEVAVTHRTGKQKIREIGKTGIPAIEIDLERFPFQGGRLTEGHVRKKLMDPGNTRWLYHPNEYEARARLAAEARRARINDRSLGLLLGRNTYPVNQGSKEGIKPNYIGFGGYVEQYQERNGLVSLDEYKLLCNKYYGTRRQSAALKSRP